MVSVSLPLLFSLAVAAPPPFAQDAPPGCDLLLRVEVGRLADGTRDGWDNLRAFEALEPRLSALFDGAGKGWANIAARLAETTRTDLSAKDTVVTVSIDLDVAGDPVFSAVIRGAGTLEAIETSDAEEQEAHEGVEAYRIDDHEAFRHDDLHWARVDDVLLVGDARGLQRQLRRALNRVDGPQALVRAAKRVRSQAPVMAAFALSPDARKQLAGGWGDVGTLIRQVEGGNLTVTEKRATLQLETGSKEDSALLAHGMRAAVAAVAGTEKISLAGVELLLGLNAAGKKSRMFPGEVDVLGLSWARESWLDVSVMTAQVSERRSHLVEVDAKIARVEGLVAVLAVLAARAGLNPFGGDEVRDEAQALLLLLRQRQRAHREANGAFVECGPIPRQVPTGAVPWPKDSCYERLAFAPEGPVRVQVQATVQGGRLLVVARADPDADGVPMVWYLDETTDEIRGFAATDEP